MGGHLSCVLGVDAAFSIVGFTLRLTRRQHDILSYWPAPLSSVLFNLGSLKCYSAITSRVPKIFDRKIRCSTDCGFVGFNIAECSTVYVPVRKIEKLLNLEARKTFAAENAVAVHVEMAKANALPRGPAYRIYFRFQFAKISKVHFSRIDELTVSSIESQRYQLNLEEVIFQLGLGDLGTDNLSYWP